MTDNRVTGEQALKALSVAEEILRTLRKNDIDHEEAIRLLRQLADLEAVALELERQAEARVPWGADP
jgi:2-phospho-L-lactate transferase/gluconeogenesis factor (CofD/UPF0052 family)